MKNKELKTSDGNNIFVFDDVFPLDLVYYFEQFAENSYYRITRGPSSSVSKRHETSLRSVFSENDLQKFGIMNTESFNEIRKYITHEKVSNERAWIILSTPTSHYSLHTDAVRTNGISQKELGQTFLYFLNMEWNSEAGGEMIFCNSHGEPEIVVSCKRNRAIVFDSVIPHRVTRIASNGAPYNYIFIAQFLHPNGR